MGLGHNERGIALVTTLMLTLIGLGITLCLLYLVTSGIKESAVHKSYKTAVEAAYGGADIMVKDMIPFLLQNYSSSSTALAAKFGGAYAGLDASIASDGCLQKKLKLPTGQWPAACRSGLSPVKSPDIYFNLQGDRNTSFVVYTKITGTIAGNTYLGGVELDGSSTSETSAVITPMHHPYLYTIEAQGQRAGNPSATSSLEVTYAY